MQLQPYQAQPPAAGANGDRITVPMPVGHPGGPNQPTLLAVFGREVRKRKKLVAIWLLVTALVTGAVVFQFAKPVYRAEGKYSYRPNYNRGPKPVYTPPNIQSALQILKAPEVMEAVRQRHAPDVSKEQFSKDLKIEVSRQSEFIDVAYDHPDSQVAAAVANDFMAEGVKYFDKVRVESTREAIEKLTRDRDEARREYDKARSDYDKAYEAKGISNPETELERILRALSDIERDRRQAVGRQAELKVELAFEQRRLNAPSDDPTADDNFFPKLQAEMAELQRRRLNEREVKEAQAKLAFAKKRESDMRPLVMKNVLPRADYDEVLKEIRIAEATLKDSDDLKAKEEALSKKIDELKRTGQPGTPPVRKAVIEAIARLRAEEARLPTTIQNLDAAYKEKKNELAEFSKGQAELDKQKVDMDLLRTGLEDLESQLRDAKRGQDLNANDLRIHSVAATGSTPYSTNAPKLALALVGASGLLFAGYMFLFGLPRVEPGAATAGLAGPPESRLPRALVALVPVAQAAKPEAAVTDAVPTAEDVRAPAAEAAPPEPGPLPPQTLAQRLAEDGVDQGGIVLFTPTAEELKVGPAIGEMGEFFTKRGERVLVFDARQDAETPSWAGPDAPAIARTVEGYLDGRPAAATDCFVPTALEGVEYSRADLATRVGGVMAAHRFRQLLEEMRERYSLVFLVGPPVTVPGGDPLLATLAEGMVLVTESSASPSEVHAFVESLNQQAPARLYGTLSVPRA
jgi:uncharacterized protein involved in exopolysaccharide biosynthesis